MPDPVPSPAILDRVRLLMRRDLKIGPDIPIEPETPFFGGSADIDSLDILLLLTSIEREFGIRIPSEEVGRRIFENVSTLCSYLQTQIDGKSAPAPLAGSAAPKTIESLPHRSPFLFISTLLNIADGQSAEGIWSVTGTEDFFRGHFPGKPIVPGVLIAEALAQLCGLAKSGTNGGGRLARVDVRFDESVVPPADIKLVARVSRSIGSLIQYEVQASHRGNIVARGSITLGFSGPTS
jgi:3-hydroxyacyl-[acyl-carrier-protein] dehydratase